MNKLISDSRFWFFAFATQTLMFTIVLIVKLIDS